jgi:probable phosphoglycerate mutase
MELLLIRHAEPVRVEAGDVPGPADPGLAENGRAQAARLAEWLAREGIDALVTSPLRRATETAAAVAAAVDLEPVVESGIAEYDATSDEYIPIEELRETKDERWYATIEGRWHDVGGIDPQLFQAQVVPAVNAIIDRHPGERVAAVCHGGVINVYLAHLLGTDRVLWFHPEYTSISRVLAARGGPRSIASVNETAHLVARRDETERSGAEVTR